MRSLRSFSALLLLCGLFSLSLSVASAHGHTTVGDYEVVIGFHNEPAYQGEPNGLDLFVTNTKTKEKVNGLADTLKAEIIYGASKRELAITPQWGEDGAYTAYVLPSEAGDYTWRIYGTIENTPVDLSMTSSPDTFGSVEAKDTVAFPAPEASAAAAAQSARTALIVGAAGVVLGLAGLIVGILGLRARQSVASAPAREARRA